MNTLCDNPPPRLLKTGVETGRGAVATRTGQIFRRILVGTDFSPASSAAFEEALELAKDSGAELLVAHSAAIPNWIGFVAPESCGEFELDCRTDTEKNIGTLVKKARKQGVNTHMLLLEGHADDALLEAAERLCADLIVVGTHDRHGVSRLFTGDVAAQVVSRAACTVLAVR